MASKVESRLEYPSSSTVITTRLTCAFTCWLCRASAIEGDAGAQSSKAWLEAFPKRSEARQAVQRLAWEAFAQRVISNGPFVLSALEFIVGVLVCAYSGGNMGEEGVASRPGRAE